MSCAVSGPRLYETLALLFPWWELGNRGAVFSRKQRVSGPQHYCLWAATCGGGRLLSSTVLRVLSLDLHSFIDQLVLRSIHCPYFSSFKMLPFPKSSPKLSSSEARFSIRILLPGNSSHLTAPKLGQLLTSFISRWVFLPIKCMLLHHFLEHKRLKAPDRTVTKDTKA
jgi:hypothetical protein